MKRRGITIWLAVAVVIIAVFIIPSAINQASNNFIINLVKPLSGPTVSFGRKISSFFSLLTEISSLRKDNQKLAEDLVESKVDSARLAELLT